jgi:hypothetical protein
MMRRILAAYRATGADPPFGDPAAAHGVGMEGYFWRFTDFGSGRVVIVLCGACGPWALVAVAASGGFLRWEVVDGVALSADGLGVEAGDVLLAGTDELRVRLPGATVDCGIDTTMGWPRRAFGGLGPAQVIPGLGQYWHPWLLTGRATGSASLGDQAVSLDGASVYAEKNWGSAFAGHWWWGQSHFPGEDTCVAFAGGRLFGAAPTSVILAVDGRVRRWAPPLARVVVSTAPGAWRLRASDGLHRIELEGSADPASAHALPVPVPSEHRAEPRAAQHLTGELAVSSFRGRRLTYRADSTLAGLERGTP